LKPSTARLALVIGAVSALGPVAIDMYLPGLPAIARDLHAGQKQAEISLVSFFLGMTFSQLVYGPLSDRLGRRGPLVTGLALFIAGSLACSVAPNVEVLILARLLQGLGGGAGQAIGSAVIRDLFTGYEAARLQATRMLVLGVSPILSPIIGAAIIAAAPWRSIFWVSSAFGLFCIVLVLALLPETLTDEARHHAGKSRSGAVYLRLLTHPGFAALVLAVGFAQGAFFAYIGGSAFVFITMNATSPAIYSLIFAVNAAGFIAVAQVSPQLMRRFGAEGVIIVGLVALSAGGCLLLIASLTGYAVVAVLTPLLFVGIGGIGLVYGPAAIRALRDHGAVAGAASALMGFMQGCVGAAGIGLVAVFANGSATPMTGVMALFGVLGLLTALYAFSRHDPVVETVVEDSAEG
jgi:DHA1 family bicyclomycin/chloramphenicol resistance-like MFS transporter